MNMKQTILTLTLTALAVWSCNKGLAQIADPSPGSSSEIHFTYDLAGNRIIRERIFLDAVLKTSGDSTDTTYADIPNEEMLTNKELAEDEENSPFEATLGGAQVSIFPNPVESKLTVRIENMDEASTSVLSLYDISGRLLYKKERLQQTGEVDFSKYVQGAYILRIVIDGKQKEWTVIKE